MFRGFSRFIAIAGMSAAVGCTVHQTEPPALTGPSTLAHLVTVTATPDRITQDGASQSAVQVQAIGPDGGPLSGIPLRMDMVFGGQVADYGTLASRTIVTGSDGIARTVYTAPPPLPASSSQIQTVSIRAIPISNNAQTAISALVDIRLYPPGVILPPAGTPTAQFTVTPTPVNVSVPTIFDGSASSPGQGSIQITGYAWNFGDGSSGTGSPVTHTYTSAGTFNVTLTVTNDRALSASTSQSVAVGSPDPFTGDWVFSPANPIVASPVLFNADQVQTSPGHVVTTFNWNFGDGDSMQPTSGFVVTHSFAIAGTYNVVLSVADDLGRKKVFSAKAVPVATGGPTAVLSLTKAGGTRIIADGSASTASGTSMITTYTFLWGDGTPSTSGSSSSAAHIYAVAGTYTVFLTVTDNLNRSGTDTKTITVP